MTFSCYLSNFVLTFLSTLLLFSLSSLTGITLFSAIKLYSMGELLKLPEIALHKILDFSDYHEVESLRNCCRYLHNFTRRRRFNWDIIPMRREKFDSAIYLFWKYGKRRSGEADHHQFFDGNFNLISKIISSNLSILVLFRALIVILESIIMSSNILN